MPNNGETMLESEHYDTTPPIEELQRLKAEAVARCRSKTEAAKAIFEVNQKLGITSAPEPIKQRYPDLRRLEKDPPQPDLFETPPVDQ